MDIRNVYKQTPLHFAATYGRLDAIKTLIENGADIHAKEGNGQTPLQLAEQAKKKRTIELLKLYPDGSPVGQVRMITKVGQANEKLGRFAEAESAYVEALEICEATFGPGHRLSEVSTWGLARVYSAQARYDEAEETVLEGIAHMEALYGPQHQAVHI